jgi:ech hydrogenase subunit B
MQSRQGPPLLQPFYDILKLWEKQGTVVNRYQSLYIWCFLVFVIIGGWSSSPGATSSSACLP